MWRALSAATLFVSLLTPAASAQSSCAFEHVERASVARVIDSETLLLGDGRNVRLIGALGPRASDVGAANGTWRPELLAREALAALVEGATVTLKFGQERTDRHRRLFAHVFLPRADDRDLHVQDWLLREGHARAYGQFRQRNCLGTLLDAEADARAARRGLWGDAAYAVRAMSGVRNLADQADGFHVVEGRVARVTNSGDSVRIIVGSRRDGELNINIRRDDRDTLGLIGGNPKALEGRLIEVRGWLAARRRNGPIELDLSTAGHIRLLE